MSDVVAQFAELFSGRTDAYGTDEGGCLRDIEMEWHVKVGDHLNGTRPIGVYPLVEKPRARSHNVADWAKDLSTAMIDMTWCCKWGCWDGDIKTANKPAGDYKDEDDAHIAARNLQSVLRRLGVTSFIERTKNHGRHVWVFAADWVPAATMRKALLVACGVAGASTREIFPKQTSLNEGQVGNYARLPYPGMLEWCKSTDPQMMIDEDGIGYSLGAFLRRALPSRASLETLESIASKHREPKQADIWSLRRTMDMACGNAYSRLGPLSRHYLASGNTADRSKLLEAFVRSAKDDGLSPSETLVLADELAAKTGKFEGRRDRQAQLERIVTRAYS